MVMRRRVGRGRAVAEGIGRAVAVRLIEVRKVEIDKGIVLCVDVIVETREEEVLLGVASRRLISRADIGDGLKEGDAGGALGRTDKCVGITSGRCVG